MTTMIATPVRTVSAFSQPILALAYTGAMTSMRMCMWLRTAAAAPMNTIQVKRPTMSSSPHVSGSLNT